MTIEPIYTIQTCVSRAQSGNISHHEDVQEMIHTNFSSGNIVCWCVHAVLFGKIEDGHFLFHEYTLNEIFPYLMEARVFTPEKELHIWKVQDEFRYRVREDENSNQNGNGIEYFDADQVMFGTSSLRVSAKIVQVSEERGVIYYVPDEWLQNKELSPLNRLILRTRNYITYATSGQATIFDTRFLHIFVKNLERA